MNDRHGRFADIPRKSTHSYAGTRPGRLSFAIRWRGSAVKKQMQQGKRSGPSLSSRRRWLRVINAAPLWPAFMQS